jgi:hypothetical protein
LRNSLKITSREVTFLFGLGAPRGGLLNNSSELLIGLVPDICLAVGFINIQNQGETYENQIGGHHFSILFFGGALDRTGIGRAGGRY